MINALLITAYAQVILNVFHRNGHIQ